MHKLIAASTILEHEISELRLLVERQAGVVLDTPTNALGTRVSDFLEAQELNSCSNLLERLRAPDQDPSLLSSLLEGLVNTNSGFFRHPGALNALGRQVLPQLCARKSAENPGPIRMWSAGCASGEETYSIAMTVCDAVNPANLSSVIHSAGSGSGKAAGRNGGISGNSSSAEAQPVKLNPGCSIHIVGSDLLPCNIETADRAYTGSPLSMVCRQRPSETISLKSVLRHRLLSQLRTRSQMVSWRTPWVKIRVKLRAMIRISRFLRAPRTCW